MILGHIGARKGSKGVPRKNFRMLHGKPLIDWSLDQLFANPRVGAVVVSTDDEEIYAHAVKRGALEIGLRPAELATDTAPKWGVWQHALAASEAAPAKDVVVTLAGTSPGVAGASQPRIFPSVVSMPIIPPSPLSPGFANIVFAFTSTDTPSRPVRTVCGAA